MIENKGYSTVFGGFLIHLVLGTLYCWANITSAVTSRLRKYDSTVTYDETILIYAAALAAQGSTMFLGGVVSQRLGTKVCCLIGGGILILGTYLASMSETLSSMIMAQGILFGVGLGLCYTAPISAAMKWLPQHKGLVAGIIVGGFGCGAFVFGMIATSVANPNHESVNSSGPDKNYFSGNSVVVENVPLMFQSLALIYAAFILAGIYLIFDPTAREIEEIEKELEMPVVDRGNRDNGRKASPPYQATASIGNCSYDENEDNDDLAEDDLESLTIVSSANSLFSSNKYSKLPANKHQQTPFKHDAERDDESAAATGWLSYMLPPFVNESPYGNGVAFTPQEILRTPLAYHIGSCLIMTAIGGMYLAGTFKTFGQASIHNEGFLAAISSIASVFNALGRIFWGSVADRIGPMNTIQIMSFLFALVILSYPMSLSLGEFAFAFWTFAIFFLEGANFVLYVALTAFLFGSTHSASNYGLIFSSYSIFVVLNIFIMAHAKVGFWTASVLMGGLTFLGFVDVCLLQYHIHYIRKHPSNPAANGCKVY